MSSPTASTPQRPPISVTTVTPTHTPTTNNGVPRRPTLSSRRSSRFAEEPMTESTPVSTHFSLDALDMAVAARWHSPSQQHTSSPLSASQQQQHHRQKTPTRRGGSGLPAQQEPQSERRAGSSETVRRGLGGRRLFRRSSSSRGSARQGQAPSTMMITQTTTRDPETVTYSVYPYNDGRRPRYGGYRHHDEYDEYDDIPTALDIGFRIANATTHLAACVVLLAIIGSFLSSLRLADGGSGHRKIFPQAVALCVLLGLDAIFDVFSIALFRRSWPGWALLIRLLFGVGYLAIFMAYIAIGRVFTPGYTYWGLDRGYAGPVVYLFLWLIGVWNLLHAALHRHQFGHDMRRYLLAIRTCCGGRRAAPPATSEQSQQTRVAHRWPAYLSSSAMRRRPSFHLGRRSLSQRHRHNHGLDAQPSFEHTVPSRGAASSHNGSGMGAAAHHANAAAAAATNNYSSNSISLSDRSAGSYAENKSVSQATTVTTTTTRSVEGRGASEERLPQSAPGAKTAVTTAEEVR